VEAEEPAALPRSYSPDPYLNENRKKCSSPVLEERPPWDVERRKYLMHLIEDVGAPLIGSSFSSSITLSTSTSSASP